MNQTSVPESPAAPAATPPTGPACLCVEDVRAARHRIAGALRVTPCQAASGLIPPTDGALWLKRDDLQITGSFKERGARHALERLSLADRARGVVAASAGNHALGLAYHGKALGVPVTLVMATTAARVKVQRCRALGADVVLAGETFAEATGAALALARGSGARWVHPFDDVEVMAGQGTVALEVLEQVPDLEAIVVPVGGGGLLAGVATVMRALAPQVRVIGVEPERAPSLTRAWQAGTPESVTVTPTLADGLAVARVGEHSFRVLQGKVDAVVTVTEDEIARAMLRLFEGQRAVVEGAGAAGLAAVLSGRCDLLAGRRTVVLVGGGNVDADTFSAALRRGLALDGATLSRPAA
ncbi:MAG: threonine/serine dehydratase [Opitutaceae bacterium]